MIRFERAQSGDDTCIADGRYLHSKYNPKREAEKFAATLNCDFNPSCVVVLGPCLSYCFEPLKKRFPDIPLYAVQYDECFIQHSKKWNGVFCSANIGAVQLCEKIFYTLAEERVFGALFVAWPPAEQFFRDQSLKTWEAVKLLLQKSRDVLVTRGFFSRRWLKNTVRFFSYARHICSIAPGQKAVVLAASGPSLQNAFAEIKKYRDDFFLISLSSALPALAARDILPDLCITTDGGYYAKAHLKILHEFYKNGIRIPVAAAAEAALDSFTLENLPIIPLRYGDSIENLLFDYCAMPSVRALRNGTVSGTAADFALSITSGPIYFCGLDLENGKGYSHTQPNALEQTDSFKDNRLKPTVTRCYAPEAPALQIYRNWFAAQSANFSQRIFRLSRTPYKNALGTIRDIHSYTDVPSACAVQSSASPVICETEIKKSGENKKKVRAFLSAQKDGICRTEAACEKKIWYENCVPAEYLLSLKYPHSQEFKTKRDDALLHTFEELFKLCT